MLLSKVIHIQNTLPSAILKREVTLEIFIPDNLLGNETLNLLLLNDGQDAKALGIEETLNALYEKNKLEPLAVVAIHAAENRIQEYGIAGMPDFLGRGASAKIYNDFVVTELLPYIEQQLKLRINGKKGFAGCSLGGISAFDIVWKNPDCFDLCGVFSGAFWWRGKDLKDGYTDEDRLVHKMIRETSTNTDSNPTLKFWLMTGTEDETADRNRNMIIDSIDDTIDVIKELLKKGYQRPEHISYYEMVGGKHDALTWSKALPAFLCWGFGRKSYS
ncbi:alpha/beta hydrolase-fold protein [Pedobacter sp. PLR]|uniref:alpha/beta hydrolase n=1 Tax=Pedobacter sp. PLR TaxID=2994465 RepID=UPI002247D679|nr:alpha/beta hydrolase-fold protein [Pedobacter sp. PLR]MCX2452688.1 alpha/beta hydrolase-fold protein [Pedobacter sp. PLR]